MKNPALSLSVSLLLAAGAFAEDSAAIRAPLAAGPGDSDATGLVVATFKSNRSELVIRGSKLAPSTPFDIEVAGIVEGRVTSDRGGKISARFITPGRRNTLLLDFDPRGKALRVLTGGVSVLEGVISGAGENSGAVVDERAVLTAENAPGRARSTARFTATNRGKRTFRVDVSNLSGGPFKVLVNGIEEGQIALRGRSGTLTFDSAPNRPTTPVLDFDPRGAMVDIVDDSTVLFTGRMEARARGVNSATPSENRVLLPAVTAPGGSKATAKLRIDKRARKHFSVELEDVATGAYDLLVDGTKVGTITVVNVTGGTEGEIEFSTGDDDPSELPLTFDPAGKTLSIVQGATKLFEGTFDPNVTGTGVPTGGPAVDLEELLASTGLDNNAKAEAKYEVDNRGRHKFSVEVEDVAVGSYTLTVGGIVRGTIVVRTVVATGKTEGELEFENEAERGKQLLTFDPRGQTIEISNATGVFFSHLFGSGSATGPGGAVTPLVLTVALTSSGADNNATASAEYERDIDGTLSFEVELEDVAVGSYSVLVGGTVRGTINVVAVSGGTKGKIEFESEMKPGRPLLDFDVLGQSIVVQQGSTVFFTRTFPAAP